eukprot:NODE_2341_length_1226_cov_26.514868_g2135_i0.p1 GENE.NODE_2341_length_1226_cov_26.514868_g2135_i0~~NODE_2341_length_1226_cov_26.514868_g2135_i0.p1  ORF type:complete len:405 (+),score=79.06 NODE_2341_length_1226_cov_26.514868_g2135_i0:93-1217(+)
MSIRLPENIDPDLSNGFSIELLQQKVQALNWGPLYKREWLPSCAGEVPKNTLCVMQFNLLAQGLSTGPKVPTPFPAEKGFAGDFGGVFIRDRRRSSIRDGRRRFDSISSPDVVLDWNARKWRLLEEIVRVNPDILTVQEIDHYHNFFEPALAALGYEGKFLPKLDSPSLMFGWWSDGTAMFWKSSSCELVQDDSGRFDPSGRPYLCCHLLEHRSGRPLVVATTHLKAKATQANEGKRHADIIQLLSKLSSHDDAVLLLGDFNAEPRDSDRSESGKVLVAECVPAVLGNVELKLSSAYPIDDPHLYTTCKMRSGSEWRRTIDYIFYNRGFKCLRYLEIPPIEALHSERLPGKEYPSDHFALAAVFDVAPAKDHSP